MKKINIFLLTGLFALTGCNNDNTIIIEEEAFPDFSSPINLASQSVENMAQTRAETNFPNNGKIGITAALTATENGYSTVIWTAPKGRYINDAEAFTTNDKNTYNFNWAEGNMQYWPIRDIHTSNKELTFIAYSPKASSSTCFNITPENDKMVFAISLPELTENINQVMPDVLYADTCKASRKDSTLNMGTFKHALAQMSVVIQYTNMNDSIKLKTFSVKVPKSGSFPHSGQLKEPEYTLVGDSITYAYHDDNYRFEKDTVTANKKYIYLNSGMKSKEDGGEPFFVIPGTDVKVNLEFADYTNGSDGKPGYTISKSYTLSDFILGEDCAVLGRAKNTRLQIEITGHNVGITATAEPWVEKGVYKIDID